MKLQDYIDKGYDVVPLKQYEKGLAASDLEALLSNTSNEQRLDLIQKNKFNIGVILDEVCVVDLDTKDEGIFNSFLKSTGLTKDYCGLVETKDGYHFWLLNTDNRPPLKALEYHGLEVRANNWIVAPGSLHEDDHSYVYKFTSGKVPNKIDLEPFNKAIFQFIQDKKGTDSVFTGNIKEGERNSKLTQLAGLFIGKGIDISIVKEIVGSYNETHLNPPLSQKQVVTICESVKRTSDRKGKDSSEEVEEDKPKTFELTTFAEMIDLFSHEESSWLVDGIIPNASCGMMLSKPELGKTWVLIELALSLTTGREFLGKYQPLRRGEVWFIQQEDRYTNLINRLAKLLHCKIWEEKNGDFVIEVPKSDIPIIWHKEKNFSFVNPEVIDSFAEKLIDRKPVAVLIDPMYSIGKVDDYFASTAQKMLKFKRLRDETDTSFLIAHHTSKGSATANLRERDKQWGSEFLNAWLEFGLQLNSKGEKTILTANFKDAEKLPPQELVRTINNFSATLSLETYDEVDGSDPNSVDFESIKQAITKGKISSIKDLRDMYGNIESDAKATRILKRIGAVKEGDKYKLK